MKFPLCLSLYALAVSLVPLFANADDVPLTVKVQRRVEEGLLKPLVELDASRSRFSRALAPPRERRVRVTQAVATLDKAGHPFVAFAIDERLGDKWHENDIVGCAYPANGALFVKRGDAYRPASFLFGQKAEPVDGVCQPRT